MREGWIHTELGAHIDLLTGYPFKSSEYSENRQGIRLLRGDNVIQGSIRWDDARRWPKDRINGLERYQLEVDDLVVALDRTWIKAGLKAATIQQADLPCLLVQRVARIRGTAALDQRFLAAVIQSHRFAEMVKSSKTETAVPHISPNDIRDFVIELPPLPEQRKIAEILRTWDTAIQKTEQLIAAKDHHINHLRHILLRHSARGFQTKLRSVTHELIERNGTRLGREAIKAVTKHVGMRPMREETIAANIERYKVVPPRAFAYNPMRLNIGSIAMSSFESNVLVSPDYVVFACDESRLLPGYLNHLRHSQSWKSHFELAGNGSVRVRIYYDDLGIFSFRLPSIAEQMKVVKLLDAAAQEIALLHQRADALRKQKRGLMQKLLTGQWRLPLPETEAL